MKQKLALCCVLVSQPEVLLLDEPTTGVDPVSLREFWDVLAELSAQGMTIVVATPYLDEAERCHRVALMYSGQIHEIGTPAALRANLGLHRLEVKTANLEMSEQILLQNLHTNIVDVQTFGDRLDVLVEDITIGENQVNELLKPHHPTIEHGEPTLENVFVTRLRQQGSAPPFLQFPRSRGGNKSSNYSQLQSSDQIAIYANNLNPVFGKFPAVKSVNIEVCYGEIFGLLGANGAGKTTTIKMLCGLLGASGGEISLGGEIGNLRSAELRKRIGYMSQKFTLYDDLTILQNLEFYSGVYSFPRKLRRDKIDWVISTCGLEGQENMLTGQLYATNQFIPKEWSGGNPAQDAIDRSIAKVAVIIPPQFSRDIKANKPTTVQVLIDATDVNNARVIRGSIQRVTNFFMQTEGILPATKRITARIRLWFNPGRLESLYIVPGVYGVILWIFPSLLTAIGMVREKEKGTILQVYASSISATELLLGKGMAYLLIAMTQALIVIGLGTIIFRVGLVNNPITLLLGTLIFLIDSVMFGLLIGVRSNNQNSTVQIISLVGFITSLLFSGFIYPLNNIPFPLSLVTNVVPARYYIDITRDAFLRGTGWTGVWFDFLMLTILGLIFFNVSRRILSKMQLSN